MTEEEKYFKRFIQVLADAEDLGFFIARIQMSEEAMSLLKKGPAGIKGNRLYGIKVEPIKLLELEITKKRRVLK